MFGTQSPSVAGHLTPSLMLLGDYAHEPLVLHHASNDNTIGSVVSDQLFVHLNASLALWNRLALNVNVPIELHQSGDNPASNGTRFASPGGAAFGDIRAGVRLRIFGENDALFQLALGGYVWFPSGGSTDFLGDGHVRGMPQVIVGGSSDRFVWSAAAGPEFRSLNTYASIPQGTMIKGGAGLGVRLGRERRVQLGPELNVAFSTEDVSKRTSNAEAWLGLRYRVLSEIELGAGFGPGLTSGVGTPAFRGLLMVAYTPERKADRDGDGILDPVDACPDVKGVPSDDPAKNGCPPEVEKDRDGDGILDAVDACPDTPGVKSDDPTKNGCPAEDPDRDGDAIPDRIDACPDTPGVANKDPKKHGCPREKDRDGDGILDAVDACPDVKGVPSDDPKKNGCPPDTDGDGILDPVDACPEEKGPPDPDPAKNGCPTSVRVTENEIVILHQVQFDTDKAIIKKVSDPLLDEVAAVLKEHPEILRVEIQGHTDNRGAPKHNETLSQQRADAVMRALVNRKVDKGRLVGKGYGQNTPIADNSTDGGRLANRRVEFKIIERAAKAKGESSAK